MNVNEHAWLKLMEESAEVSQRVSKIMQFGPDEKEPGQDLTNLERLKLEILDTHASVHRLQCLGQLPSFVGVDVYDHITRKEKKVEHYLRLSKQLGMVTE